MFDAYVEVVDALIERSFLVADAAASATVLTVVDGSPFLEGTQVQIAGEVYEIASVFSNADDDEAEDADWTLTLATGLVAPVAADEPVDAWPLRETIWATVSLPADAEDTLQVRVPQSPQITIPLGMRGPDEREIVSVDEGVNGLEIVAVNGKAVIDGSLIDPDTVPPATPVAPESSPTPTVDGFAGLVLLRWDGLVNSTFVEYDVHVSASNASPPDSSTLVTSTGAVMSSVRTLANGSALAYGTTYYFAIWARSGDEYAPGPSSWVAGQMDKTKNADLAANAIDGMTITGATVRTAASGQRVQMDVDGLKSFDSASAETARLSAASGGLALSGEMVVDGGIRVPDTTKPVDLVIKDGEVSLQGRVDGAYLGSLGIDSGSVGVNGQAFSITASDGTNLRAVVAGHNSGIYITAFGGREVAIEAVKDPTAPTDAANKRYVDTRAGYAGWSTLTIPAANTVYSKSVTFPAPMASLPIVNVTPHTARPDWVRVSMDSRTVSGFKVYGINTGGAYDITFHWTAVPQ